MRMMGIVYEIVKAAIATLIIALKAAVLPILIRPSRTATVAVTRIEYSGRPELG